MAGPTSTVAGPTTNRSGAVRQPAVAGSFYPADPMQCRRQALAYVAGAPVQNWRQSAVGAIVPHAGWVCSGAIAGLAIAAAAKSRPDAQVIVVFGAVHVPAPLQLAAMDTHDAWQEPGTATAVAGEIRRSLAMQKQWFTVDNRFHEREHAVEVILPLIQAAWPAALVLPVQVPVVQQAVEIGRATAQAVIASGLRPVYLASSDLTHYGPNYQFAPAGVGREGLAWAKANDRLLLEAVMKMSPGQIVPHVVARRNACGPGAIAAMMAACQEHGATHATVLAHATSYETLAAIAPQPPDNAVGYAAVMIG